MQETFLAAWERLDDYEENLPFAGWLRGIARHKILAYCRDSATARKHVKFLGQDKIEAIAAEFERLIPRRGDAFSETILALGECLAKLRQPDHEVIERAYRRRQTCKTIGAQLGQSAEAVKKRIQRARAQLRDCILGNLRTEAVHV